MEIKYYITVQIPDNLDSADIEAIEDCLEDEFRCIISDYGFKTLEMEIK